MAHLTNADDFRDLSIVEFLAKLGHHPVKKSGKELFYHSMLRETTGSTPSFTVWDEGGKWLDRGGPGPSGIQGGGIVQLAMAYWPQHSFVEVLGKISEVSGRQLSARPTYSQRSTHAEDRQDKPAFLLVSTRPIGSNYVLNQYLESRGILDVAEGRLRELYYRHNKDEYRTSKPYYAVGWQNDLGNWEFADAKGFKSSIGKKSISVIPGNPDHATLFEGFMDYLSWLKDKKPAVHPTVVVLNSIVQLNKAVEKIKDIPKIDLYLDNDGPGRQTTKKFMEAAPHAVDRSDQYSGFKDYNEKLKADLQQKELAKNSFKR